MRTNVIYTDTRYEVFTDKKEVKCTIDAILDLKKMFNKFNIFNIPKIKEFVSKNFHNLNDHIDDNYVVHLTRSYTAKCKDEDVFDESLGRKIAETYAQAKIFRGFYHINNAIVNYTYDYLFEDIDYNTNSLYHSMFSCMKHYCELGDVTEEHVESLFDNLIF